MVVVTLVALTVLIAGVHLSGADTGMTPSAAATFTYDGGNASARTALDDRSPFDDLLRRQAASSVAAVGGVWHPHGPTLLVGTRFATNSADALGARANEIHGALDPIAQSSRTTAVMSTREGPNVIASGGRDLSPAQRALTGPEDVLGKLSGAHAEVTAIDAAAKAGLTPAEIAASRPICPACQAAITESGGQVSPSGWWAWWPG